jgi:hypothetical protein
MGVAKYLQDALRPVVKLPDQYIWDGLQCLWYYNPKTIFSMVEAMLCPTDMRVRRHIWLSVGPDLHRKSLEFPPYGVEPSQLPARDISTHSAIPHSPQSTAPSCWKQPHSTVTSETPPDRRGHLVFTSSNPFPLAHLPVQYPG